MMVSAVSSTLTPRALEEVVVFWLLTLILTVVIHLMIQVYTLAVYNLFQLDALLSIRDIISLSCTLIT